MITFFIGLSILLFGYIFYSKYVDKVFGPVERDTASKKRFDGVDFVPLKDWKNQVIHLLNIAGMGPILAAIQGCLFGPWMFIIVPLGCVFMGAVHDYMCGMISVRNDGLQITGMIKKYLGTTFFRISLVVVSIMLFLWVAVFVYGTGDIFMQRFLHQTDFTFDNPVAVTVYSAILLYFVVATVFPIDKIIGRIYPIFGGLLMLGTLCLVYGFITKGISIPEASLQTIHIHPKHIGWIPFFFMTVSCGLLSGSHATQAPIVARTVSDERDGRKIFYGMMCLESVIVMIWGLAAMSVMNLNLVPQKLIGTANVVNIVADHYASFGAAIMIVLAVLVLPITSGDTALRGVRMIISEALNICQKPLKNRLAIVIPSVMTTACILVWAKVGASSFSTVWRYVMFFNQLIALPMLILATVYLYQEKKNYFLTLIPGMFYIFILSTFFLNAQIGLNMNLRYAEIMGIVITIVSVAVLMGKLKHQKTVSVNVLEAEEVKEQPVKTESI